MEFLVYALLVLVGLWVLWKLFGLIAGAIMAPCVKALRNSPEGRAIHQAVNEFGQFDGSPASRQRAHEAFVDLAEKGPLPVTSSFGATDELARAFSSGLTNRSGPILLEAAYTVVGGYRLSHPSESLPTTREERDADLNAVTLLIALFEDWAKKHQVGMPGALAEQKHRMALVIDLLEDRCVRTGLLLEPTGYGDAD